MRRARTCIFSSTRRPRTRSSSPGSRTSRASPSAGRTPARPTRSAAPGTRRCSPSSPPKRRNRVDRSSCSPGRGMTDRLSAAEGKDMAVRLAALLPRAVIVALVWILGTAAFTLAADNTIVGPSKPNPSAGAAAAQTELVVPSVSGQAYVFAKGILEDSGFAWRVIGSVRGYSSNRVITQSPAAGTRVVDTGAPTVIVRLVRGPYAQLGRPVDVSPYRGTAIRLAGLAAATTPAVKPKTKPAPKKPDVKPKVVAKPKAVAKPKDKATPRPPAFTPAGAPREPLDEITLPARALTLQRWVANRPKTGANV